MVQIWKPEITKGFTPLLIAALNGDTLIMQLLIKKGVDLYAANNSNNNALDLAIIADNQEAVQFLLRGGDKWGWKWKSIYKPIYCCNKIQEKRYTEYPESK